MASATKTSAGEKSDEKQIEFDYDNSKKYYLEKIGNPRLLGLQMFTKVAIEEKIKNIVNKTMTSSEFIVRKCNGEYKLFSRSKVRLPEVISIEDAFYVVMRKHIEYNHGDAAKVLELLQKEYYVPKLCLRLAIEACNVCRETETKLSKEERSGVWRLNVIPIRHIIHNNTVKNRHLLIYKHNETNFLLLRPVYNQAQELGLELMKIFLEFGMPSKLVVPCDLAFYKFLFEKLQCLHPGVKIFVEKGDRVIFDTDKARVLSEMGAWAQETGSTYWDIGCHIVQYRLNTSRCFLSKLECNESHTVVPFNLFFGSEANLPNKLYKDFS